MVRSEHAFLTVVKAARKDSEADYPIVEGRCTEGAAHEEWQDIERRGPERMPCWGFTRTSCKQRDLQEKL